MKYYLLAGLLSLAACGSADTSKQTTTATSTDPRISQIRALHQQLLALQKPIAESEQNPLMAQDKEMPARQQEFAALVAASQASLGTLNQLNPDKSQDAMQAALVGESLQRHQAMVQRANSILERNRYYVSWAEKTTRYRDSLKNTSTNKANR
jgi:uncharacterized protein (DUF3084 family)